ncbi:hypothetical protein ASU86_06745 [Enterobacter hormaechei subsp. steigerwaltii]|nr:hypothetical protein ASU86_06745 [Enterobacter hormaechei subsp. steigerwaltii]
MRKMFAITGIHAHSVQQAMLFTSESHFHGSTHLTSSIPLCLMKYQISGIGPMVIRSGEIGRAHNLAQ